MQKNENKKYEYILFDLDGTLLDTAPQFHNALNILLRKHSKEIVEFEEVRIRVSDGAGSLITLGFGFEQNDQNFEPMRLELLDEYSKTCLESKPFEGIKDVLEKLNLKKIAWGIVTNKPSFFAEKIIKNLKWDQNNVILVCPDHVNNRRKPKPDTIMKAINMKDIDIEHIVYVGDCWKDIDAAKNAGLDSVLVKYGYSNFESIKDVTATIDIEEPKEILNLF